MSSLLESLVNTGKKLQWLKPLVEVNQTALRYNKYRWFLAVSLQRNRVKNCKAPYSSISIQVTGLANQPANHLPSVPELGRSTANSCTTAELWVQLLHQCFQCSSSANSLLWTLLVGKASSPAYKDGIDLPVHQACPWILRFGHIYIWHGHYRKQGGKIKAVEPFHICDSSSFSPHLKLVVSLLLLYYKSLQILTRFPATYLVYNSSPTHIYFLICSTSVWDTVISVHLVDLCFSFPLLPLSLN